MVNMMMILIEKKKKKKMKISCNGDSRKDDEVRLSLSVLQEIKN